MGHLLLLSSSQWQSAGHALRRQGQWIALLYGITLSVLANWVMPNTSATTALFTIAIGLPLMIFRPRIYIGRVVGVVMVLIGIVWLYVIALRAS